MAVESPIDASAEYRPVSPLAIAALAAGCCSALAVMTRFAWAVPLVGIALSWAAALPTSPGPKPARPAGWPPSPHWRLSVGFGGQAIAGLLIDRWIMAGRAKAAAHAWIDAVREGRISEALSLCGHGPARLVTAA